MMGIKNVKRFYGVINRSLTRTDGQLTYQRITAAITRLADSLAETETDEAAWSIGEFNEATLADMIIGAYWHYAEWHAGQYSAGYAALSALGHVFGPGMTNGPEPETGEETVFQLLEKAAILDNMPVYDNGGESADRYTVFPYYRSENEADRCQYLGISEGGRAVSEWGEVDYFDPEGVEYLGERIPFSSLSQDTKNHIIRRCNAGGPANG